MPLAPSITIFKKFLGIRQLVLNSTNLWDIFTKRHTPLLFRTHWLFMRFGWNRFAREMDEIFGGIIGAYDTKSTTSKVESGTGIVQLNAGSTAKFSCIWELQASLKDDKPRINDYN